NAKADKHKEGNDRSARIDTLLIIRSRPPSQNLLGSHQIGFVRSTCGGRSWGVMRSCDGTVKLTWLAASRLMRNSKLDGEFIDIGGRPPAIINFTYVSMKSGYRFRMLGP